MGINIIIVLICIAYIYSQDHMKTACIKILKQLVDKNQLTEEEFNNIKKKVYNSKTTDYNLNEEKEIIKKEQNSEREPYVEMIEQRSVDDVKQLKEKSRQNNISALLYLGVILIMFAGLVFATTTWEDLTGVVKAILLFGFSGMLFGASNLSEKKMKLEKTAFALWILGTLFFPITCICAGYLEVFGNYFSLNSEGKYLFALFSSIVCLPIYIISVKKYLSKTFSYIAAINVMLIGYFMFLNISDKTEIILIAMGLYNLIVLVIFTNITAKSKFSESMSSAMVVFSKITLVTITTITIILNNINYKVSIIYLLNYIIIIGNYKYICIKQKSYLFSIATAVTAIAFFSSIYSYLVQNNIIINLEYISFMFNALAIVCAVIQGMQVKFLLAKKWDGLRLLMNVTNTIFISLLTIISFTQVLNLSNTSYEVLIFAIITLMLLLQKKLNYKKIQTEFSKIIDISISIFTVIVPFTIYRYLPENININLILYFSIICFIPWVLSKITDIINKNNTTITTYRGVGTLFLIITFMCSFIEINPEIAIYKFILSILLVVVVFINYIDYLKSDKQNNTWDLELLNISYITIIAPIFIILTAWLTIIPLYFTTFIAATLIYLFSLLDNTGKLLEKSKFYILFMIILSNIFMMVNITGILEYIFMQSMLLVLYFNKTFRKLVSYNIYLLCALVINTILITTIQNIPEEVFNLFNILILLIVSGINIYNYYELKSISNNNENLSIQKLIISFGLLIGLIPYMYFISYISNLLNMTNVINMILIQVPILFIVFSIEKLVYNVKNSFTYIVSVIMYFIATVTLYEFNDILTYSIMLLILVIIGSSIRNKSMFLIPAIFLIIFVLKGTIDFWVSIPWWLYLLIGGSTLVYLAMKRESSKQNNIDNNKPSKLKQFLSNYED
ncbi:MAG: hypothetical protein PHD15_04950 [Clostridia bacterium]|nr:hypothetical protein [Clostridia bacterium]MDD4387088.1 hypothetical protein [Clostridia bacterium]